MTITYSPFTDVVRGTMGPAPSGSMADAGTAWPELDQLTPRDLALASAQSAADATAELLRFAREGETATGFAFDEDTLPNLADALATAALIESERAMLPSDQDALNQLAGACRKFQMDYAR